MDYSLYLVTDSTPAILGQKNLVEVVEAAVRGGVTIVQYRDKTSDTAELVSTARKLHAVTMKYNVPLLINDRVDVALAVGCEGVHIGQEDLGMRDVYIQNQLVLTFEQISRLLGGCSETQLSLVSQPVLLQKRRELVKMEPVI